jgi:hypothetical protein
MFKYPRAAIIPLATLLMPISHGMAEVLPTVSWFYTTAAPLIRVQSREQREAEIAECLARCMEESAGRVQGLREMQQRGLSKDAMVDMINADSYELRRCQQGCRR